MSAKHPYLVSTAAAARLLIMASKISSLVSPLALILQGLASVDSIDWDSLGSEAMELRTSLERAISRSQRARAVALKRSKTHEAEAPEPLAEAPQPEPVETPEPQPEPVAVHEPEPAPEPNEVVKETPRYTQSASNFPQYYVNMLNGRPPF